MDKQYYILKFINMKIMVHSPVYNFSFVIFSNLLESLNLLVYDSGSNLIS